VLSEDELAILTLSATPVDDQFFATLAKAKRVRKDCELLLGLETQTLGLEVMDQASRAINQAFQKLHRWVQHEFKSLNFEKAQIGLAMGGALRALAERPSLFQSCLDFFAEAREQVLSDGFLTALTGSTYLSATDPTVKPIELAAHDPLRYVGDMLAWTHSAAVGEREALEMLFIADGGELARGIQAGRENEVWHLMAEDGEETSAYDAVGALNELVDKDVSGCARILRQRVEQVIQTNEEAISAYKLANLVDFYRATFSKLLGSRSVLVDCLDNLAAEALRQFRFLTREHVATVQGEMQHIPSDLSPPGFLHEALEQLAAIMKTFDISLVSPDSREAEFRPVLEEAFAPFMDGCNNMGASMAAPDGPVFLLNCLATARSALAEFDFTTTSVDSLQGEIERESETLVDFQYQFFRSMSGLDEIITALSGADTAERIGTDELPSRLRPDTLAVASQRLDDFLPSALMDAMEHLRQLQDAALARGITEKAAEKFCLDFELVENQVERLAAEPKYSNLRDNFPRTSGEIRVLLS